ncbi:hypothetical protein Rumeso_03672 [Rubellimicrobium mesophilum DSM 19309]|uniref:PD-(D/E)XK nuclease superfamily protein n=1 Tax=Rubellimicrobium mesophilum DSM 19309 TaxID=442562 RepID=A0A017HLR3_9RHOB|nr:PD-(D/E)XK nuclease family protein [Rubellimicrobium mesophilum]EYD74719.1 hypothetical protein Rumeso_03672 [Rubellimicrobium mesophilum DSM 19309]
MNVQTHPLAQSPVTKARPNLFRFAPSELSQDAFLGWLLEWADHTCAGVDPALHRAGLRFLNSLLAEHGFGPLDDPRVEVRAQEHRIDLTCRVNGDFLLLIEDKTDTSERGKPMADYLSKAKAMCPELQVLPVLLKTGDQSSYEVARKLGYRTYLRADLLKVLEAGREDGVVSDIFTDFLRHLRRREDAVQSFRHKPLADWTDDAWRGFYMQLQLDVDGLSWDYVANPSGGFLAAWWHRRAWGDHTPYLQIEQGPLCFKIEVEGAAEHRKIVDGWLASLNRAGDGLGLPRITNGRRFRAGTWMTVATWDDWMVSTGDGRLDYAATLANLQRAEARLEAAL